ncbi:MAG: hypothetical protein GF355_14870, partial [Candidatus Eisenbacteria bacterium]|nr:hypothetical protein [Candidatus Eisenbacteria bacterium]
MRRSIWIGLGLAVCGAVLCGCGGDDQSQPTDTGAQSWDLPYKRLPTDVENTAEYGPGDEMVLEAIEGGMGRVVFPHFTHASNAEGGYRIPCRVCHHNMAEEEEFASEGCTECHRPPHDATDPAHGGPDDNMLLMGEDQDPSEVLPVPFTHFT